MENFTIRLWTPHGSPTSISLQLHHLKVLGPGKAGVTTIMVPILGTYYEMTHQSQGYNEEDRTVLQYGLLMTTCYTGLYMAAVYFQATYKYNSVKGELIDQFWASKHSPQYFRLIELLKTYIGGGFRDRYLWRWSRVLRNNYLARYSSKNNEWICAVYTALITEREDDTVWNKKCFEGMGGDLITAKTLAKKFKDRRALTTESKKDSILFQETIAELKETLELERRKQQFLQDTQLSTITSKSKSILGAMAEEVERFDTESSEEPPPPPGTRHRPHRWTCTSSSGFSSFSNSR